ncbi:MAG: helix-turn-helix domain-containing protein [Tetragenococcus koreensis]|nr:helix-turn-helix domain-containing protein [Tetragenococcus koreensis]
MEKPGYYSIIPSHVRYDEDLKPMEIIMYGELTALANFHGYSYATNNYFAKLYKVHKNTVSTWINTLKNKGYIRVEVIRNENKEIVQRNIYINTPYQQKGLEGYQQKDLDPINEKIEGNSTRFNNTSINRESNQKNKVDCIQKYQQDIGIMNPNQLQQITDWITDFDKNKQGEEIISEAINQSVKEKAKSFAYLNNKLKRYADANVQTLDDAKAQDKEYNKKSYKKDLDVSNVLEGL